MKREKDRKVAINAVVLGDERAGVAIQIDRRYHAYFATTYKGCEFLAPQDGTGAVLVRQNDRIVGVAMPIRVGDDMKLVLGRALAAQAARQESMIAGTPEAEHDESESPATGTAQIPDMSAEEDVRNKILEEKQQKTIAVLEAAGIFEEAAVVDDREEAERLYGVGKDILKSDQGADGRLRPRGACKAGTGEGLPHSGRSSGSNPDSSVAPMNHTSQEMNDMQPIMNTAQQQQKDTDFDRQLQAARVSVLAQAGRSETVKKSFTASAAALVAAAMFAVSMAPQQAHAGDITFERIAKDALGGAAGAALFGQFGKGRGRDAMRVIGAVAGVAVAESLQQPKPQTYTFSMSPGQGFSMQQNGGQNMVSGPALVGGTEILSQDKREKLATQERSALAARDMYARTLHALQQAEENQVLSPRSKSAQQETSAANSAAQSALQQYATARADFMNACEFMAKRGYDMQEFAYNYSLMQRTVTAKDMHPRDMAEIDVQRRQYAAPAY